MNSTHNEKAPAHLNDSVLHAIRGALQEEKEPRALRALKICAATAAASAVFGIPFFLSFRDQLNFAWGIAWAIWTLLLLASFCLHFHPQPRLMLSGVWSPYVLARILLVATVSTVLQILICPSFVFLTSNFDWNPMYPITKALMHLGGMNLCMIFCGFIFSFISSLISLIQVGKVTRNTSIRNSAPALGLLICAQAPVLAVLGLSEDLRGYILPWALGLAVGAWLALALVRFGNSVPTEMTRSHK